MGKLNDVGVFQLDNGFWAYRYTFTRNGKRYSKQSSKDEYKNPLRTRRDAVRARQVAVDRQKDISAPAPVIRKTFKEVYDEYCDKGRGGKAYTTILKQESLWKNHLCKKFGSCFIDEITVADVNDYLTELYYENNFSFQYTESFLKMFYLIFGQAYSRNYLEVDKYNKLCLNKDTKIRMPKRKIDDDTDIVAFTRQELSLLDDYFKGTNAETAYLLGRYCGLRINECFGLKWSNVDLQKGTIYIDRQMQYQEGLIKLVPPKTRNAKRVIFLCDKLLTFLKERKIQTDQYAITLKAVREQKQRYIDDIDGSKISSTELVNCLPNGQIQTVSSMKYHSREIKSKLGIEFKYHYLRHTYGTLLAEMNTPQHLLCNQMGHGNINVTQLYYLAISKTGVEALQENLNRL